MLARGQTAKRISTHAIETQIASYPNISDAVGFCYPQEGHIFFQISFPSAPNMNGLAKAGATWVFDSTTEEWHERVWFDPNGIEYRHRAQTAVAVYETNVVGDWQNSNLYSYDLSNFTDNGQPMRRVRSFPHQTDTEGFRRIIFHQLVANMQTGDTKPTDIGPSTDILNYSFTASNGTLLQNYANSSDVGSSFSLVNGVAEQIESNALVLVGVGSSLYALTTRPSSPDYSLSFNISQSSFSSVPNAGCSSYVIARAVANLGYQAGIISTGTGLSVFLGVMPATPVMVALGSLTSGFYTLSLMCHANLIEVAVQRSDGSWLTPLGTWHGTTNEAAISIHDSTFQNAGQILIGGIQT